MRCGICKKKKIVLSNCRCGLTDACIECIGTHICSYDYVKFAKKELEKNIIKVVADKIEKI